MKKLMPHEQTICPSCKKSCRPLIKEIKIKNSDKCLYSAYCTMCNQYIENIPEKYIKKQRKE